MSTTEDIKERRPEIPWPKVAGIGNVLRHAYDYVAPDVLWISPFANSLEAAGVEFIDENGGGPGVRLRKSGKEKPREINRSGECRVGLELRRSSARRRWSLMDVKERAASILGGKTDIMTRNSLHPRLRKRIEEAAVLIF